MTDLAAAARILVADTIVRFGWDDFGLDEVGESDPEYADDLAAKIVEALTVLPGYGFAPADYQRSVLDLRIQATHVLAANRYSASTKDLIADTALLVASWNSSEANG